MKEEDFTKYLEKFNGLFSEYSEWHPTRANKEHKDDFGNDIEYGEIYYKREYGAGYHQVFKISGKSLAIIFQILFWQNRSFEDFAEHGAKEKEKTRMQRLQDATMKFSLPLENDTKKDQK